MNLVLIVIFLAACSSEPSENAIETAIAGTQAAQPTEKHTDIPPTETPPPTQTPEPTYSPAPTNTTEPPIAPTSLPEGVLFRDDFEGALQPGWSWLDEDPERWSFKVFGESLNLAIIADNPAFFNEGYQVNTLARDVPAGEFAITAHVMAEPNENFKQANIFIFQDASNYIVLNIGFCDLCFGSGAGDGFFMETIIDNNPFGDAYVIPRNAEDKDVYLKLVNERGSITGYYALRPGEWQRVGAFGNYFDFVSVGLGASNATSAEGPVGEDLIAYFDYFEISAQLR
ncbi:hypothetical protein ACFLV7_02375 [Chloroflexota bacterium]